jgi:hypothetical protein
MVDNPLTGMPEIRDLELGALFTRDGRLVDVFRGDTTLKIVPGRNTVRESNVIQVYNDIEGGIFIHNHPGGGTLLSDSDIRTTIEGALVETEAGDLTRVWLSEIQAVNLNYTASMRLTEVEDLQLIYDQFGRIPSNFSSLIVQRVGEVQERLLQSAATGAFKPLLTERVQVPFGETFVIEVEVTIRYYGD